MSTTINTISSLQGQFAAGQRISLKAQKSGTLADIAVMRAFMAKVDARGGENRALLGDD